MNSFKLHIRERKLVASIALNDMVPEVIFFRVEWYVKYV